ncbi:hypothetical protein quinque_000267 [Culex quinquefasciatus]
MDDITAADLHRLPETINFPAEEEKVLKYWKDEKVFEACLKQSKGKPRYTFYDGPPFATGLPHYGHILAGTVKDIVTRYAHQQGYHVERRFGWDCHGLPVEYEIDKTLNIRGPEDVARVGIKAYNGECRKIVMRYANEWEEIIGRMGRWIDFKNDYKTLYPWYMESIWWVFKQLYVKGLVYQGVKVMPYSTACTTALSNFESGQNYKEVTDPAVFVSFPIVGDKDGAALVGWTTTPWTLPSNMACCVHPDLGYAKVKELKTGKVYVMMECRIESMLKGPENYEILERFAGSKLAGVKYEPLFDYFRKYEQVAFRVLVDGYVTEDSGTGVVHQAPYFGEDDYRVCLANGVITRDQEIVCPVDPSGKFVDPVSDFQGQYVKDADKNIIKMLKEKGRLVLVSQVKHNYPFCWRSDTPLIYRAVPSWFVRVEHMTKQLLACSSQTYWVPEYVKEKRFGNWLRDARDWAISRNRYWGTPIPLWMSADGQELVCIGSIEELERLSGVKVEDLHRESIDHIEIPSAVPGNPPLKRISEVFDCWFESGSMPFAQNHYPFENAADFLSNNFPADFIAEGIDQTRGWFYTLLVISTALFNKPPKEYLDDIKSLENFILGELNVRSITLSSDKQKYGVKLRAEPDHKVLGMRLKNGFKQVIQAVKALTDAQIAEQLKAGFFTVLGHRIELNELRLIYQFDEQQAGGQNYEAHSDNDVLVLLDMTPNEELMKEGVAREIINRIQKLKKKAKLIPTDPVLIYYTVSKPGEIKSVAESHQEFIVNTVKSPFLPYSPEAAAKRVLIEESQELKGIQLNLVICSPEDRPIPASPWLNLILDDKITPRYQQTPSRSATILLISPSNQQLTLERLHQEIHTLFGLNDQTYNILTDDGKPLSTVNAAALNQRTLFITRGTTLPPTPGGWKPPKAPLSAFRNVEYKGAKTTLLEENPVGVKLDVARVVQSVLPDIKNLKLK